jgi:hypothetical protein
MLLSFLSHPLKNNGVAGSQAAAELMLYFKQRSFEDY